jgi:hypothetical protein
MKDSRLSGIHLAALLAVMMIVVCFHATATLEVAQADINDKSHLGFLGWDEKEEDRGPKWITRNLVVGEEILVCTTDYPAATRLAADRWNVALGITAFKISSNCNVTDCDDKKNGCMWSPKDGVVSLTVSRGEWIDKHNRAKGYMGKHLAAPCDGWGGCAGFDRMSALTTENKPWRSYHGRAEIVMNPDNYSHDYDASRPTNVIRDIAHEMGHILALADYFCHVVGAANDVSEHPDRIDPPHTADKRTLMNSFTARPSCNALGDVPSGRDKTDYRAAYLPAKVVDMEWSVEDLTVTLTWDQNKEGMEVFVESGFEVQRRTGSQWEYASKVDPNEESVTFSERWGGPKHYRIVSRTSALKNRGNRAQFGYVDIDTASEVVTVTVKLRPPGNPRVPTRTDQSLTLEWDKVDGADGYDVRRIRSTDSSTCDSTAEEQTTLTGSPPKLSHRFAIGVNASTTYLLCVRATLAQYPQATSEWASTTGATNAPRVDPPPQPETKPKPTGVACLNRRDAGILITYRTVCDPTTASALLTALIAVDENLCGIWKWENQRWQPYARTGGDTVPGSVNYTISGGAVLWLIACASEASGSEGGWGNAWPEPPAPTAEELERLARLAAK